MNVAALFHLPKGVRLLRVTLCPDTVVLDVTTIARGVRRCPCCQAPSDHFHSTYTRILADAPCVARQVTVRLQVRKFRCRNAQCSQRVFAERFPAYASPRARQSVRLQHALRALGLLAGGRGAQAVAHALGIRVSDETILRRLRDGPESPTPLVRVLGVDDFAFRRGRTYGTVLVDLERRQVIDLLPDRAQMSFALWLQRHAEVRVISRDRGGDYAAAASLAAPEAEQVADRFHLLANAGEALERCLTRQHVSLREAARALGPVDAPRRTSKRTPVDEQRRQQRRASRKARYEHAVALHQEGLSVHQIAAEVGLARDHSSLHPRRVLSRAHAPAASAAN